MKLAMPSLEQTKVTLILAGVGAGLFVLWKIYRTGADAAESVNETIGNVSDTVGSWWHSIKGTIAEVGYAITPGSPGPSGGGSRQELQTLPRPDDEIESPEYVSPFAVGAFYDARTTSTLGGDGSFYGDNDSQDYSPDAMGTS